MFNLLPVIFYAASPDVGLVFFGLGFFWWWFVVVVFFFFPEQSAINIFSSPTSGYSGLYRLSSLPLSRG